MKRRMFIAVGGGLVAFLIAVIYLLLHPRENPRVSVSFLGYTSHQGESLAVFQLMNNSKQPLAVLPGSFELRTAVGMVLDTNHTPRIYGDIPPGILSPQTSATFAMPPPPGTNAWCFDLRFMEFRRIAAWQVRARRVFRQFGIALFQNKARIVRTPEITPTAKRQP